MLSAKRAESKKDMKAETKDFEIKVKGIIITELGEAEQTYTLIKRITVKGYNNYIARLDDGTKCNAFYCKTGNYTGVFYADNTIKLP